MKHYAGAVLIRQSDRTSSKGTRPNGNSLTHNRARKPSPSAFAAATHTITTEDSMGNMENMANQATQAPSVANLAQHNALAGVGQHGDTPCAWRALSAANLAQHNALAGVGQHGDTPHAWEVVRAEQAHEILVGRAGDFPTIEALKPLSSNVSPFERFATIDLVNNTFPVAESLNSPSWFDAAGNSRGRVKAGDPDTVPVRTRLAEELFRGAASHALAARSSESQTMAMELDNVAEQRMIFICPINGCRQQFETAAELRMHKREAHER
ncbi:MAG: hypothetical protein M1829_002300 [Trizodia sp. TS-e1964]|nr:MAG: hypothetical protein M1829_002300 [Trizodia sp. TS-e1964]